MSELLNIVRYKTGPTSPVYKKVEKQEHLFQKFGISYRRSCVGMILEAFKHERDTRLKQKISCLLTERIDQPEWLEGHYDQFSRMTRYEVFARVNEFGFKKLLPDPHQHRHYLIRKFCNNIQFVPCKSVYTLPSSAFSGGTSILTYSFKREDAAPIIKTLLKISQDAPSKFVETIFGTINKDDFRACAELHQIALAQFLKSEKPPHPHYRLLNDKDNKGYSIHWNAISRSVGRWIQTILNNDTKSICILQYALFLQMMVFDHPPRNIELTTLQIVHFAPSPQTKGNFIVIEKDQDPVVILNDYATLEYYHTVFFNLSDVGTKLLNRLLGERTVMDKTVVDDRLFVIHPTDSQKANYNFALNAFYYGCGMSIPISNVQEIYLYHFHDKPRSWKERLNIAAEMGHNFV